MSKSKVTDVEVSAFSECFLFKSISVYFFKHRHITTVVFFTCILGVFATPPPEDPVYSQYLFWSGSSVGNAQGELCITASVDMTSWEVQFTMSEAVDSVMVCIPIASNREMNNN